MTTQFSTDVKQRSWQATAHYYFTSCTFSIISFLSHTSRIDIPNLSIITWPMSLQNLVKWPSWEGPIGRTRDFFLPIRPRLWRGYRNQSNKISKGLHHYNNLNTVFHNVTVHNNQFKLSFRLVSLTSALHNIFLSFAFIFRLVSDSISNPNTS